MTSQPAAPIHRWLTGALPREVSASIASLSACDGVRHVAVMPDVHLAENVCVGVAMASARSIFPAAVGRDIGCGMAAVRLPTLELSDEHRGLSPGVAAQVLDQCWREIPILMRRRDAKLTAQLDSLFARPLSDTRLDKARDREGVRQFATLGRGNHFLELQLDDEGTYWLMVHSGSRGMGQAISVHHERFARPTPPNRRLVFLPADDESGQRYLADVAWAIEYAARNRRAMLEIAASFLINRMGLGWDERSYLECHHNHVLAEVHFGESLWVHRKGATPAAIDQPGIIPGSMGTSSLHVVGRGCELALRSSSHGAGRVMSRSDARRRIGVNQVRRELANVHFHSRLLDSLREEAPSAYKNLREVMWAQRELVRTERTLRPVLVHKGGN